ncbi:MAG: 2-hydroxyacid dehydrogenase [Dehalococcoidia bacterium]
MTRVLVTRELPGGSGDGSPIARLRDALGPENVDLWPDFDPPTAEAFLARTEGCDGILCMITDRIDAAFLDARPTVRAVAQLAVGYDNIDVPACTERGVLVTNTPDVLSDATADMAWALLMAAARRLPAGRDAIEQGRWGQWNPTWMLSSEVTGRTLGILGPGRIGAAAAKRASGFEMTVLYTGRREKPGFPGTFVPLEELLARSDFISVHVPLTDETRGMCDAAFFRRMQPHAIFVNTSRGPVVDQSALIAALEDGTIAAAGLDVMTPEPLPPDDPLVRAPNIVLSPHVGSATLETRTKMAHLAVDGLLAGLRGERVRHLVNPDALNAASRR